MDAVDSTQNTRRGPTTVRPHLVCFIWVGCGLETDGLPRRPPDSVLLLFVDDLVVRLDDVLGCFGLCLVGDLGFLVVKPGLCSGLVAGL